MDFCNFNTERAFTDSISERFLTFIFTTFIIILDHCAKLRRKLMGGGHS